MRLRVLRYSTSQDSAKAGRIHHLYDTGSITEAACWAHARRKFHDIHVAHPSPTTTEAIERALLQQSGPKRGDRDVALSQMSSSLNVKLFTKDRDSFRKRTGTNAEGAFDKARLASDVLGEVEDGRLALT